ncbi:efflux RND transporter periplasmic adaptor subunit [Oribacterium sp. P6A1]|uniref:efflux RND transporter periplasmic adaptor subunit n=1 Tax=Oribacterium sp. P6A1 TaxID=1410612 RepID=UPI000568BBD6|nr:biotin/lipoyl-binding protein [Oribacterium sp. P6A1]
MKKRILIFILVILVGLTAFYGYHYVRLEVLAPAAGAETGSDTKKQVVSEMTFSGRVESSEAFTVDSLVTGKVFQVYANKGRKVLKGDAILLIDNRKEVEEAKSVWDETVFKVTEARVKASSAVSELNRITPAFNTGEMNAEAYQQVVDMVNLANEELNEAIRISEDAKSKYETAADNALVKAPADGRIGEIKVRKEQEVAPGDTLFELEETSVKYVLFRVEKELLSEIFPGKKLTFLIRDIKIYGSVIGIRQDSDDENYYTVKAFPKEDVNLPEGMSVSVKPGVVEDESMEAEDTGVSSEDQKDKEDSGKKQQE